MKRPILVQTVFRTPDDSVQIVVSIRGPMALPNGRGSRCEYEMRGQGTDYERFVLGVDNFQALEIVFTIIRADIEAIEKKLDIDLGYRLARQSLGPGK